MSRNCRRDTKPEVLLRKACWATGMRYVLNAKLPGRPDFIFPRHKVAVFVDGCFWHGCAAHYQQPATRADFWLDKLVRNRSRVKVVNAALSEAGWHVVRVWEHTVRRELERAVVLMSLSGILCARHYMTSVYRSTYAKQDKDGRHGRDGTAVDSEGVD
jgi:DNA mismatch endonuclease (patch repair protein)